MPADIRPVPSQPPIQPQTTPRTDTRARLPPTHTPRAPVAHLRVLLQSQCRRAVGHMRLGGAGTAKVHHNTPVPAGAKGRAAVHGEPRGGGYIHDYSGG